MKISERNYAHQVLSMITLQTLEWIEKLKHNYSLSSKLTDLVNSFSKKRDVLKRYSLQQRLILRKGRLVVGRDSSFKGRILKYIHTNPMVGHSRFLKTYQRAKRALY